MLKQTHTYVTLDVPSEMFEYVKKKLEDADYKHCFVEDKIVMDGIALIEQKSLQEKYNELIYSVERKFPDEDRHQTALRYIQETERYCTSSEQVSKENETHKI